MIANTKRPFFSATRRLSTGPVPAYKSFLHRTRFLLLLLVIVLNSTIFANSISIIYANSCMNENSFGIYIENGSSIFESQSLRDTIYSHFHDFRHSRFTYSPFEKLVQLSIAPFGCLVAVFPIWNLAKRFGYRRVCFFCGLFSSISTISTPWSLYYGIFSSLFCQFLQGLSLTCTVFLIPNVIRRWSTRKKDFVCFMLLSSFSQIGPIFSELLFSQFCDDSTFGWPVVFYCQGIFTFLVTLIFLYFYKETPIRHANVSDFEIAKIGENFENFPKISYAKMLKCTQFGAIFFAVFVHFLSYQLLLQFNSHIIGAILMITHLFFKIASTRLMENNIQLISKQLIQLIAIISNIGSAIILFLIIFIPEYSKFQQISLFFLFSALQSLKWPSILKSFQIISGEFYLQIITRLQCIIFISTIIFFNIISMLSDSIILIIIGGLEIVSIIWFILIFRFEKSDWEKRKKIKKEESKPENIAPVSHPRPAEFSESFGKEIVVSVISYGLNRCDTCRRHGIETEIPHKMIPTRKIFDEVMETKTHM